MINISFKNKLIILIGIILTAFALRINYLGNFDFPLNDGGMFYQMIMELIEGNFRIPTFTNYNNLSIPFAYPPLSLLLSGLIYKFLGVELSKVLIYFPLTINLIAIPIIFLLAKEILSDDWKALIATAFWSLSMPSYEWTLMGGGVTRSLALTSSFICLFYFLKYLRTDKSAYLLFSVIFCGITGLSHLEGFWVLSLTLLIFAYYFRTKPIQLYVIPAILYIFGTLVVLSPYLIPILKNHGFIVFLDAFRTGGYSIPISVFRLITFDFTREQYLTIVALLAIIGVTDQIIKKRFYLILWITLIILLDIRSADRNILFPLSILGSIGLIDVIILSLGKINGRTIIYRKVAPMIDNGGSSRAIARIISYLVIIHILILGIIQINLDRENLHKISKSELIAFTWVKENIIPNSVFLITPFEYGWQRDSVSEWFPVMTGQRSLLTVQGTEWLPRNAHKIAEENYNNLLNCIEQNENCFGGSQSTYLPQYDYLWVTKYNCLENQPLCYQSEINQINSLHGFTLIFENSGVAIFSKE